MDEKRLAEIEARTNAAAPGSDVPELVPEVRRLRGILRLLEWTGERNGMACCPRCRSLQGDGTHAPGCVLGLEIGLVR